jgi:hypothetical protein
LQFQTGIPKCPVPYKDGPEWKWEKVFSVSKEEMQAIFQKWRELARRHPGKKTKAKRKRR